MKITSDIAFTVRKFEAQPGYGFSHLRFYAGPGQCIAIDIVILNHASPSGTKYFFTILDCFSHWPEAVPMKDMTAESCAKALWQWIRQQGAPMEIRSDRGQNLNISRIFQELYKIMRIKGVLNAAWSPQSNQVERLHKWLGAALRLLFDIYDMDVDEADDSSSEKSDDSSSDDDSSDSVSHAPALCSDFR